MNIINSTKVLFLILALFLVGGGALNAQISGKASSVSMEAVPQTPGPFERVLVRLSSFSIDLNRSNISWFINGKLIKKGIGEKTFSFTTGGVGETSKISASVSSGILGSVAQTISFTPSEVDLLWEAIGVYTPPFYKGKALPTPQSLIKVIAFPHLKISGGNEIKNNSLVYKWKKNSKYKDFNNQSGYGRNSVVFRRALLRQTEIVEVEVSSKSGGLNGYARLFLGQYSPDIIFYEQNPVEGVLYEKALGNEFDMKNSETTIVAEPYFFSTSSREGDSLLFEWRLNNKTFNSESSKGIITFRTDGESGMSKLSLSVRNLVRFLQFTNKTLNINF